MLRGRHVYRLHRWLGGAPKALLELLPALITFFLVALNCKKPIHVKMLVALLFLIATFIVVNGMLALRNPTC